MNTLTELLVPPRQGKRGESEGGEGEAQSQKPAGHHRLSTPLKKRSTHSSGDFASVSCGKQSALLLPQKEPIRTRDSFGVLQKNDPQLPDRNETKTAKRFDCNHYIKNSMQLLATFVVLSQLLKPVLYQLLKQKPQLYCESPF